MVKQELGRHLLPRPAKIEADTEAAFSDDVPVDPFELAAKFVNVYLMPWSKEMGEPSARSKIDRKFDE
eukprot:3511216-Alexandrium_andersonii.AAC.1